MTTLICGDRIITVLREKWYMSKLFFIFIDEYRREPIDLCMMEDEEMKSKYKDSLKLLLVMKLSDFELVRVLGKGGFSTVYEGN